eukprot:m.1146246 g.1146246  ORF g.1146246 m.1146246 type:complete len:1069 (+) comp24466_c0_seq4:295-3501(+)
MSMQGIGLKDSGMSLSAEDSSSQPLHVQGIKATVQNALSETIESIKNAGLCQEQLTREENERAAAKQQQIARARARHQGLLSESRRLEGDVHRIRTEKWHSLNNGANSILRLKAQLDSIESQIKVATAREAAMKTISTANMESNNLNDTNIRSVLHALENVCEQTIRNANSAGNAAWAALRSTRDTISGPAGSSTVESSVSMASGSLGAASLVLPGHMDAKFSNESVHGTTPLAHDAMASDNLDALGTANETVAKLVGGLEKELHSLKHLGDAVVDTVMQQELTALQAALTDKQRALSDVERRMLAAEDNIRNAAQSALQKLIKRMQGAAEKDADTIRELETTLQHLQRDKERQDQRMHQELANNNATASTLQDKLAQALARGDDLQRKLDAAELRESAQRRQTEQERGKNEQSNADLQRLQKDCGDLRHRAEQAEQQARQVQMQCDVQTEACRMSDARAKDAERDRDMLMVTGERLKDDITRLEDELAKCTANMRLSEAEVGRHRSDNQRNELTANELRAALSALEAQRLDEQRRTFDLQADLDSSRRKIAELEEELRRQTGLVDDFKQRAQKHADNNRTILATRDTADDQRIDAERKLRMQSQELDDANIKVAFLEAKVLELRRELDAAHRGTDAADRADYNQRDAAHVAATREMDNVVSEVMSSKQLLEQRVADLERDAAASAGAHAADTSLLQDQLALAHEQVREAREHEKQLGDEVRVAVERCLAAEARVGELDMHLTQRERERDADLATVQRLEDELEDAEARATEKYDTDLAAAQRRIEELEMLVDTMKPMEVPPLVPRGTNQADHEHMDAGASTGRDKPLAVAQMEAELDAVRAELNAAEARANRAELELQHARERGNGDIDVLRKHAQVEAEKLIETNNRLHEKLMSKRQEGQSDLLVRLAFLEAENQELRDVVDTLRNSAAAAPIIGNVRVENARMVSPRRQRSPGKKRFLRFRVAVWDSPPARALGIAQQDAFIAVGSGEIIFADKNNTHVLRCPCQHVAQHGFDQGVLSIEISTAARNASAAGLYYFATPHAAEIHRVLRKAIPSPRPRPVYASPP